MHRRSDLFEKAECVRDPELPWLIPEGAADERRLALIQARECARLCKQCAALQVCSQEVKAMPAPDRHGVRAGFIYDAGRVVWSAWGTWRK